MSLIAMYQTINAMKKAVGQPFRYINTNGGRMVFNDWAGDPFEVIGPHGTEDEPSWRGLATIDEAGLLTAAQNYDEWRLAQDLAYRRAQRQARAARQPERLEWQPFEGTLQPFDANVEATVNRWIAMAEWEAR